MERFLKGFGLTIIVFITAPLLIVVPMSFSSSSTLQFPPPGYWLGHYRSYFASDAWVGATMNSITIALAVTVLTMALVIPASFAIVRHRFRGKGLANVLMMMPMAVPHIVIAVGYYSYLGKVGLVHSKLGVVLAHTALSVPIAFLVLSANLKGFDRNLERAAQSLGASPARMFWHVTLPILRPGIVVSAMFAFIASFDETVVAIFISGRDAETLPRKMFDSIRQEADPVIAVISTLLFVAVILAVAGPVLIRWLRERAAVRRTAQPSAAQPPAAQPSMKGPA